jgi:hypothetical protein
MTTIKAVVRHGRIEVENALNLPDGTELTIPIPDGPATSQRQLCDQSDAPEAVEAWLRWLDSLEPLEFSEDELAAWQAARKMDLHHELSDWDQRSKRIEGLLP